MGILPFMIVALSILACSSTQAQAHGLDGVSVGLFFGPLLSFVTAIISAIAMPGKMWQGFATLCGSVAAVVGTAFALGAVSPLIGDNGIALGAIVGICICASLIGGIVTNRLTRKERVMSVALAVLGVSFGLLIVLLVYGSYERLAIRFA